MTTHKAPAQPVVVGRYDFDLYREITFVESHGLVYPLTPCCEASATGTEDGIACRSCYEEVSPSFGACWSPEAFAEEFGTNS